MKSSKRIFYLYGLFCKNSGKCFYVGVTLEPKNREMQHRNPWRGHVRKKKPFIFRIISEFKKETDCMKTEIALIKGLKAIKQASWNVRVQTGKMIKPSNSCVIIWKEKNRKFEGMGEAGRYFGISETTVGNICKRDGVLTKGVTLYRMEK